MNIDVKYKLMAAALSFLLLTGFGLGDLKSKISPDKGACEDGKSKQKCKNRELFKSAAKVAVVGAASKMIYDMVIKFKSTLVSDDVKIEEKYKKKHKSLPKEPALITYNSSLKPGEVVNAGKLVLIESNLEVVRGKNTKNIDVSEKIAIYDNEDHKKLLKELTKPVNKGSRKSGLYKNEFSFTLPIGMPQGVYPVKTMVIVNKKEFDPIENKMQLVLKVNGNDDYQFVALRNP